MSKAKTPMVYFLSLSIVFAFMVTTVPTLATAETLAPSEPGVSLGKPLSGATLQECTAMGVITIDVVQSNVVIGDGTGNVQNNTVIIKNAIPSPFISKVSGPTPQPVINQVKVPSWFHKK
jgi:hypothetical protein